MRQELLPEFKPYQQPVIANDKVRYVGEPIAVVVADSAALAEDALERSRSTSRRCRRSPTATTAREERKPAVRGDRPQPHHHAVGGQGRCRGGVPATRLTPAASTSSVQRFTAVTMEPRGLLAEWDAAKGHLTVTGMTKVLVPQPPHPGEADGPARRRHHHDRGRCRRRLRRARRVLSRGFPDSVRGAKAQPRGEMGRGPPREPDRLEPRPRRRMRAGDRLRARRHDPRPARRGRASTSAPTSAPTA